MHRSKAIAAVILLLALPFVVAGKDVTPIAMLSPNEYQDSPFMPEALFAEKEGTDSPLTYCFCIIASMEIDTVYFDYVVSNFSPFDTIPIIFPLTDDFEPDTYQIVFYAKDDLGGEIISHPPLVDTFYYKWSAVEENPEPTGFSMDAQTAAGYIEVRFSLIQPTDISVAVYDITGAVVAVLASGDQSTGSHSLRWNTSDAASGIYFVRLLTPERSATRKVLLLD